MNTTIAEYLSWLAAFIKDTSTIIIEYWSWLLIFIKDTSTTTTGYWSWVLVFIAVVGAFIHYIVLPTLRWIYFYGIKTLRELPALLFNEVIWIVYALIRLVGPLAAIIWIAYAVKTKEYEFVVLGTAYGIACVKFYSHLRSSMAVEFYSHWRAAATKELGHPEKQHGKDNLLLQPQAR